MSDLALFRHLPILEHHVQRLPLCELPTPVRQLPALGARMGCKELWVKDDGATDGLLGGNKVRILELVLPEAMARGERLVAMGPTSSNWVRAACFYGRQAGARMEAVMFRWPAGVTAGRMEAAITGAAERVRVVQTPFGVGLPLALLSAWRRRHGSWGVILPPGGSSSLGALAYASAALELAEDVRAGRCTRPDRIYVALGSGATAGGLAAGLGMADLRTEVVAVRVAPRLVANRTVAMSLARKTCRLVQRLAGLTHRPRPAPIRVIHSQSGWRYGGITAAGEVARRIAMDEEGLLLDPTYSAKTVAGMLGDTDRVEGDTILYWHTLGREGFRPTDLE